MCDRALRRRRVLGLAGVLLLAAASQGDPYWIAWEGDDWPENQGWTRSYGTFNNPGGGQAKRTLENGLLTIDGIQGLGIYDGYIKDLSGTLNPEPGEQFVARWTLRVDEIAVGSARDPVLSIVSDDLWGVTFIYSFTDVWELSSNREVDIEPGMLHEYELRSSDMRTYSFAIDGVPTMYGSFAPRVTPSRIVWGDGAAPSESRSTWAYLGFGVVPEPGSLGSVMFMSTMLRRRSNISS